MLVRAVMHARDEIDRLYEVVNRMLKALQLRGTYI